MFSHSELFVEKENDGSYLVQGKYIDGTGQRSLNTIFFPVWYLRNVVLCYQKKHNVSLTEECKTVSSKIFMNTLQFF